MGCSFDTLLNNLDEGVVIMEQETGQILFHNIAAKRFNFISKPPDADPAACSSTLPSERNAAGTPFCDLASPQFARIERRIFAGTDQEVRQVIKQIEDATNYESVEQIIEDEGRRQWQNEAEPCSSPIKQEESRHVEHHLRSVTTVTTCLLNQSSNTNLKFNLGHPCLPHLGTSTK